MGRDALRHGWLHLVGAEGRMTIARTAALIAIAIVFGPVHAALAGTWVYCLKRVLHGIEQLRKPRRRRAAA